MFVRSNQLGHMSPFAHLLHDLRMRHGIRQSELAELIGYEQSYISALEVGLKGPPTPEFVERLTSVLRLTDADRQELNQAAQASQRKLVIDHDTPQEAYWLLNDLRHQFSELTSTQIRVIRDVLQLRPGGDVATRDPVRRLKRRTRQEATM